MLNHEELLLVEAYESVHQNNPLKEVINLFKQKGWEAQDMSDTEFGHLDGIAVKEQEGIKYDVYFYVWDEKKTLQFSAYAVMPERPGRNEYKIPFAQASEKEINTSTQQSEYSVPLDSDLNQAVDTVIDEVLAWSPPDGPSSTQIENDKAFEQEDQKRDLE